MFILDKNCVVRRVKARSQVIKPVYAMFVRNDKIFEDKEAYISTIYSDIWNGIEYEQFYFVSNKGKLTASISRAKTFKSRLSYMWWSYWHCPMDIPAPHRLVNIAPYLESLKDPRNKWCELKEWLEGQNWRNPLDEYDMETYVEKDKLMAKIRELDDEIIVPYDRLKDT